MKSIVTCLAALFIFGSALAQPKTLVSQGVAPKNYLLHTVAAKENLYSVGRLYNVTPKELAAFNGMSVDKGLNLGQALKIPLLASNYVHEKNAAAGESLVPVYAVVGEHEGLYRVSVNAGAKMEQVRSLNKLTSDALATGARLLVGYLKVKTSESALAGAAAPTETEPVKKDPAPVKPVERDYAKIPAEDQAAKDQRDMKAEQERRDAEKKRMEQEKKAPVKPVAEEKNVAAAGEGFFKSEYQKMASYGREIKNGGGMSGIFKTMSGWQDGKYYALMDGVTPGSIIKITHKQSGRSVYAKVLGEMQELKQNSGLVIRISNAAASALEAEGDKFDVSISY